MESNEQVKHTMITISVSKDLAAEIDLSAKMLGLSRSAFMRQLYLAYQQAGEEKITKPRKTKNPAVKHLSEIHNRAAREGRELTEEENKEVDVLLERIDKKGV